MVWSVATPFLIFLTHLLVRKILHIYRARGKNIRHAVIVGAGDLVTLSGELGAGKTAFARALIRKLTDEPTLEVPSPTFTLAQSYELPFPIVHADLYRINDASELEEIGLSPIDSLAVEVRFAISTRGDRHHQAEPIVGAQRLRMHARQLGRDADREDRRVAVDELRQLAGRVHEVHHPPASSSVRGFGSLASLAYSSSLALASPPR